MDKFEINDPIECINDKPLEGKSVCPPLKFGFNYTVKGIVLDSQGNQHLDVGLESKYNYIESFETKEDLPNGNKIHWCHPSRFKPLNK